MPRIVGVPIYNYIYILQRRRMKGLGEYVESKACIVGKIAQSSMK